jgi:hypothetical protein
MWFCSLFLYSFPSLATIHSVISPKPKLHNQQEDRLKCGYMHKGITLNLPVGLLLSKKAKGEGNRVEPDVPNRCSGYRPDILLTALIPQSNIGITVAEYPTFFFYIPDANLGISQGEFVLRNENDEEIYKKTVKLKATDSIVTIDLSSSPSFPPLEVGKSYSWGFSIIFDERDRSADSYVFGWIKRVEPNSEFQHKLATALPQEKPGIYATNGIWYEALASLATLRCTSPNNSTLTSDWESLLQQVGLPEISKKPLAQCAEAKAL